MRNETRYPMVPCDTCRQFKSRFFTLFSLFAFEMIPSKSFTIKIRLYHRAFYIGLLRRFFASDSFRIHNGIPDLIFERHQNIVKTITIFIFLVIILFMLSWFSQSTFILRSYLFERRTLKGRQRYALTNKAQKNNLKTLTKNGERKMIRSEFRK